MARAFARSLLSLLIVSALLGGAPLHTASAQEATVHIVQRGETLFLISLHYDVPMSALIAANNISDPSRIYAGQRLIIPGSGGPSEAAQRHVVQRGETLADIARQYGISYWNLARANNITNPSLIYAGQVLVITESTAPSSPQTNSTLNYTVQRGDTLFKIAVRYGTTVAHLMALNGVANMDRILVGQQLIIPTDGAANPPASEPQPTTPTPATTAEGKQIVVNLTQQKAYAYENGVLLREFVVSTGLPGTPTVTGDFAIYVKYRSQWMSGPGYSLPGVPWVMYFYKGYGLHGTYWHDNFGHPMSHGCVNMRTEDALWVYEWAPVGTPVHVTY